MKKTWLLGLMLLAVEIVIIAILIPGDYTGKTINKELAMIERSLGAETLEWVKGQSQEWYVATMLETGIKDGMYYTLIPTEEQKAKSTGLETFGDWWFDLAADRIDSLMLVIQQLYLRVALLVVWAPYVLLLLIPAIFDGVMTWKIKATNFDYASPVKHRYSARVFGFTLLGMLMMFLLPLPVPPSVIPIALMVMCIAIGLMVGNYQKRI